MMWTKEKPTEPGYYWLRNYLFAESKAQGFKASTTPVIVHLYKSFGEPLSLTFTGNDSVSSLDDFAEAEWYGPLALPTEGIDNWNMPPPRMANSKVAATFRDLPGSFIGERFKIGEPTRTMIEDAGRPSTFVQDRLAEYIASEGDHSE